MLESGWPGFRAQHTCKSMCKYTHFPHSMKIKPRRLAASAASAALVMASQPWPAWLLDAPARTVNTAFSSNTPWSTHCAANDDSRHISSSSSSGSCGNSRSFLAPQWFRYNGGRETAAVQTLIHSPSVASTAIRQNEKVHKFNAYVSTSCMFQMYAITQPHLFQAAVVGDNTANVCAELLVHVGQ